MKKYGGFTGGWLTFWVSVSCITCMTLFGYDQGVFGGVIITPDWLETMGHPNDDLIGTITSIYDVGSFFGALSGFSLGEWLGRKKSILLGTVVMIIGAILQFAAFGVPQMIAGRVICGLGNGLNTASAPVWSSETSKVSLRGKLVIIAMIFNIGGFSLSNWMTYGFSFAKGSITWRFPLAFQVFFGIIILATVPWLPESPRWLIRHGKVQEGSEILAALQGGGATVDDPVIITELKEIENAMEIERRNAVSWMQILRGKTAKGGENTATLRRLLLGAGTQAMQQLAGINVTSYYLPYVLIQSVKVSENLSRLLAACNSVSYLLFSLISIPNVERWGRRRLMIFGAIGQCFCYMLITILIRYSELYADDTLKAKKYGSAAIAFFFLYYVFFGIGWQGVPWLYPTEINSLQMRTKGAALGTAANWAFNYMVVQITPKGINSLHWKFYVIWTVFNASFVPIVYFFYPETANRRLEDIDKLFRDGAPVLIFRDKEAISPRRPYKYELHDETEFRRHSSVAIGLPPGRRLSMATKDDYDRYETLHKEEMA